MNNSDSVSPDQKVGEERGLTVTEIFYLLLSDLREITHQVESARSHANENQPTQSWGSFIKSHKIGHLNPRDLQNLLKQHVMASLTEHSDDVNLIGEPQISALVPLELRFKLLDGVKKGRESIQHMSSQLQILQESNKDVLHKIEELRNIMTARRTTGEMKTVVQWMEVNKKIKAERAKTIKDIRYVTEHCIPDSNATAILTDALKCSSTGKDPYISVEESSFDDVEFLLRCGLISRHPHNQKLVRLLDPIQ